MRVLIAAAALSLAACGTTAGPGPVQSTQTADGNDCAVIAAVAKQHYQFGPNNVPPPNADPMAVVPEYAGTCTVRVEEGRTQWFESGVHHNGFTTAWPPNKKTPGGPNQMYADVDINCSREKLGRPSFAAVTARSYHSGGVNALFADGSVRFCKDSINGLTWRALGSVAGGEVVSGDSY